MGIRTRRRAGWCALLAACAGFLHAGCGADATEPAATGGDVAQEGGAADTSPSGDDRDGSPGRDAGRVSDGAADVGAPAPTVPAGPWANINLQSVNPYAIDLAVRDYPVWVPTPSHHVHRPTGGWDGGPVARILAPTIDQTACGLGGWNNLWRSGALAIRKLNVRFELLLGPTLAQRWNGNDWKFFIAHTSPTLIATDDPGGGERPMANFARLADGVLGWAVGAGTVKNFNRTPPHTPAYGPTDNGDFFMGAAAGTRNGKPVVGPNTWISVEIEIVAQSTTEAPNGRIRSVLTRRDGTVLTDLSIPWTYDQNWTVGDYVATVQLIGGYWNTGIGMADPNAYYEIADRITFAANRPGLLGPRAGFVP